MFKEKALLTFYAETPVHMGAGQAVSYVDLPVQRERITGFPTLWSSGIKGVIRELAERVWNDKQKVNIIFGPEEESSAYASCLSITDAKILLYPVRSVRGVFAWITCPLVLKRFVEDLKSVGIPFKNGNQEIAIPELSDDDKIIISSNSALKIDNNTVALEEFVFNIENGKDAESIADFIKKLLPQNEMINSLFNRIAIVPDDVFKEFVNYAVEVRTRIRIDQTTGTVEEKALFNEELIPSESIFYSMVFITDPYNKTNQLNSAENVKNELKNLFKNNQLLQLGGDETTGKGFMRVKFYSTNSENKTDQQGGQK